MCRSARISVAMKSGSLRARKTAAEAAGEPLKERRPSDINGELFPRFWAGAMHNAYIAPLRDLSVKGVIWYQGESNEKDKRGY